MKNRKNKITFAATVKIAGLLLLVAILPASAQVGALSENLLNTYVDQTETHPAAVDAAAQIVQGTLNSQNFFALEGAPGYGSLLRQKLTMAQVSALVPQNTPGKPASYWKSASFDIGYGFNTVGSNGSDDARAFANSITPEFIVTSTTRLTLDISANYQNMSRSNNVGDFSNQNGYGIQASIGKVLMSDTCGFWKYNSIAPNLQGSYGYNDGDSLMTGKYSKQDANVLGISPSIIFTHTLVSNTAAALTIIPSYSMQWNEGRKDGFGTDTNSGVFSLLVRGSYKFLSQQQATFSVSAAWFADTNQKVPAGQAAYYQNWATFGSSFRYTFVKPKANCGDGKAVAQAENSSAKAKTDTYVQLGYTYTAFRADFDRHSVAAAVGIDF